MLGDVALNEAGSALELVEEVLLLDVGGARMRCARHWACGKDEIEDDVAAVRGGVHVRVRCLPWHHACHCNR